MVTTFSRFPPRLQEAIVSRLGWSSLRPVQELAGEALLNGDNAVILAPTAGGKTEASIFPTLAMLLDQPADTVGALSMVSQKPTGHSANTAAGIPATRHVKIT